MEHEVAQSSPELEDHHQAGKVTSRISCSAVLSGVLDELQLGELERFHHQGYLIRGVPLKYQVICGVGHWEITIVIF